MSGLVFLIDESDEEEVIKPETKEEQELGVIWSWIDKCGASQPCQRRRHGGYYVRCVPPSLSFFVHGSPTTPSLFWYTNPYDHISLLNHVSYICINYDCIVLHFDVLIDLYFLEL